MDPATRDDLIAYLGNFITDERKTLIDEKLAYRTRFLTVVLEDIYNPHNASAVIRSCECFGIQDLYVVEQRNEYQLNPGVTRGSSKWIDLHRFRDPEKNNIVDCYDHLTSNGYRILAATPDSQAVQIADYELNSPVALVFGTEMQGLTAYAKKRANEFIHIPMVGFTESFNISVSAALCLYELTGKLHRSDVDWKLNETQKQNLKLKWYRKVVRRSNSLEKEFFKQRQE